jgi:hypothetical protein
LFGYTINPVSQLRTVTAEFEKSYDFCPLLLADEGELKNELLAMADKRVSASVRCKDEDGEEEREGRKREFQVGKRWAIQLRILQRGCIPQSDNNNRNNNEWCALTFDLMPSSILSSGVALVRCSTCICSTARASLRHAAAVLHRVD